MAEGTETTPATAARPAPDPSRGARPAPTGGPVESSLVPPSGWHFLHLYYKVDRGALHALDPATRERGRDELRRALTIEGVDGVAQGQCFVVPGHKADFGLMLAGPNLRALHGVQMSVEDSALGPAMTCVDSFYSITEVSEYVPTVEQYGRLLVDREGVDPDSDAYQAKVGAYERRLEPMNRQRLYPEFPDWPCMCFYPMSKMRQGDQNWYLLPFEPRSSMMAEHGRSGMTFAGKVTQVITASTGLDDWEWGVTLWSRNPSFLKDIVYTMRFDESSAKYALFGDFFFGYILPPDELVAEVRI